MAANPSFADLLLRAQRHPTQVQFCKCVGKPIRYPDGECFTCGKVQKPRRRRGR